MKTEKKRGHAPVKEKILTQTGGMKLAGYFISILAIMAFFLVLCYTFINNENPIRESDESRLWLMFSVFGWLLIGLTLLLCAAWMIITFLKTFFDLVRSMIDGEKRLDIGNTAFLKILSILIFILLTAYLLPPGSKMTDWFILTTEIRGMTGALIVLALLAAGYLGVHIIYKLLESFVNKESGLKRYVGLVAHMLTDMTGELLICLLRFIRFLPDFMSWGYSLLQTEDLDETEEGTQEEIA